MSEIREKVKPKCAADWKDYQVREGGREGGEEEGSVRACGSSSFYSSDSMTMRPQMQQGEELPTRNCCF